MAFFESLGVKLSGNTAKSTLHDLTNVIKTNDETTPLMTDIITCWNIKAMEIFTDNKQRSYSNSDILWPHCVSMPSSSSTITLLSKLCKLQQRAGSEASMDSKLHIYLSSKRPICFLKVSLRSS